MKNKTDASASKEKHMKKLLGACLALICCVGLVSAESFEVPTFAGGIPYKDPSFVGMKHVAVAEGTLATQVLTGEYLVYGICGWAGAVGDYSLIFDTLVIGKDVDSRTDMASPRVNVSEDTTTSGDEASGCWWPKYPVQILKGVDFVKNSTTSNAILYYRPTDGNK